MQQSLFQDCLRYLLPFGLGGAVKSGEEQGEIIIDLMTHLMTTMFVEHPPANY